MMSTTPTLNPQILGQAESAHRALLEHILAKTGHNYHHWVAISLTAAGGGSIDRDELVQKMAGALKIDDATARAAIGEMTAAELIEAVPVDGPGVHLTNAGQELYGQIRGAISEIITRLYSDFPADDLATAGRVLTEITARANAELARSAPKGEAR
jgi:DNA-binding MarR family transcriptional regulator